MHDLARVVLELELHRDGLMTCLEVTGRQTRLVGGVIDRLQEQRVAVVLTGLRRSPTSRAVVTSDRQPLVQQGVDLVGSEPVTDRLQPGRVLDRGERVVPDRDPVQAPARQLVASVAAQVGAGAAPRVQTPPLAMPP